MSVTEAGRRESSTGFFKKVGKGIGSGISATGRGITTVARKAVSADQYRGTGKLGHTTQGVSMAAGAAGGGFLARLGAKLAVTKTKLAEKLSPQAKRATVEGATVVGGIAGAIGLPKLVALLPFIKNAAATAARAATRAAT